METPIWINGQVMPLADARIGVEDRGYQFADGVYEVVRFYGGKLFTVREHLERLARSAEGIRLALPTPIERIEEQFRKFVPLTGLGDGCLYLQLTRGVATPRNHRTPKQQSPTMLFYALPLPAPNQPGQGEGVKLLAMPDERWKRCWIKCIGLTANILAKNEALDAGYDEAVFVDRDVITECSSSNLFAVIGQTLVTHPVGARFYLESPGWSCWIWHPSSAFVLKSVRFARTKFAARMNCSSPARPAKFIGCSVTMTDISGRASAGRSP